MVDTDSGTQQGASEQHGSNRVDWRLYGLLVATTVLGIGHHLEHVIRGNHVGWPLIPEVTPFTYTLLIYPLLAIGLYLTITERVGVAYWVVLLGAIFVVVVPTHFGPWAIEPPRDILGPYSDVTVGYAAIVWLLGFVGSLIVATAYSVHRWRWWTDTRS